MFFVFEQNIKRSERTVAPGNILLHVHFILIAEFFVAVDVLFQYTQAIPEHHDFMKEIINRYFFWL